MINSSKSKYRFNWRDGNKFSLLIDGDKYFPRMLAAITGAQKTIWLEMYLFESSAIATRFIDALRNAANRGVQINVLLDDFGSRGLETKERTRLAHDNIKVCFYNKFRWAKLFDNMARDHRKLLVVDGEIAFVGGAGITDVFSPADAVNPPWRETMLEIRGPVLDDWQKLFSQAWLVASHESIETNIVDSEPLPGSGKGRVMVASGIRSQGIMRAVIKRVRTAEKTVWLSTAYFVPSRKLRKSLRRAAMKGVDVRLLLPGSETDHPVIRIASHRYYTRLLRSGVRIFEYQPRMLHSKALICDQWVSMGSSNFDRWNLRWNLEANQAVLDADFLKSATAMFVDDFLDSNEINLSRWLRRPGYLKWWERFWGRVDRWLHLLGRGRQIR